METVSTAKLGKIYHDILFFYYRFRFLNSNHIQQFLTHKNPRYAQRLLKNLLCEKYVYSFYNPTTVKGKATPAVYCFTAKAKSILKQNNECDAVFLESLYREKTKSIRFRNHCLFLADFYFLLNKQTAESKGKLHFSTKTDLLGYGDFPKPLPDAYIAVSKRGKKTQRYLLTIIDPQTPWYAINSVVQKYLAYFEEDTWKVRMKVDNPILLFICWEKRSVRYLKKAIRQAFEESYIDDLQWFYTTRETVIKAGLHGNTWNEVTIGDDV